MKAKFLKPAAQPLIARMPRSNRESFWIPHFNFTLAKPLYTTHSANASQRPRDSQRSDDEEAAAARDDEEVVEEEEEAAAAGTTRRRRFGRG